MKAVAKPETSPVLRALDDVQRHPQIVRDSVRLLPTEGDDLATVEAIFRVALPHSRRRAGISATGVKAREPVTLRFPKTFPRHAPRFFLRPDFPRSFAHIQPDFEAGPPEPCLLMGDRHEFLRREGMLRLLDQMGLWLNRAADNTLIRAEQGWEPMRRDHALSLFTADLETLRRHTSGKHPSPHFKFRYLARMRKGIPTWNAGHLWPEPIELSAKSLTEFSQQRVERQDWVFGDTFAEALVVNKIIDQYGPDPVTNLEQLLAFAGFLGCRKELESRLSAIQEIAKAVPATISLPVLLLFCVKRPIYLIGQDTDVEIIAYCIWKRLDSLLEDPKSTRVYQCAHSEAVNAALLQRVSGLSDAKGRRAAFSLIGCGSLGSKIGMHMARAGVAPHCVIDKKFWSPHNAARNALLFPEHEYWRSKAEEFANAMKELGQETKWFKEDVVEWGNDAEFIRKRFGGAAQFIVNSTASLVVREVLGSFPRSTLRPRVIEASLFGAGNGALLTMEGADRNPGTMDLIAEAYRIAADAPGISSSLFTPESGLAEVRVGDGCSSETMVMTDAKLSLSAAAMSSWLLKQITERPADDGAILFGEIDANAMGIQWGSTAVRRFRELIPEGQSHWVVRLSPTATKKIDEDIAKHSNVETGGWIIGLVSEICQSIIVVDIAAPPPDSVRERVKFEIGKVDRAASVDAIRKQTDGALRMLGTWHSHLQNQGPSPQDYATAKRIAVDFRGIALLVVRTPKHWRAIIETTY